MNCKKCDSPKTVVLRKKDYYCDNCFMTSTNHKFRACLGKNKVISPNETVLIALSGGAGSTVLLDLVHHGITLENTKKLRITPLFIHLFDNNRKSVAELVLKQCAKYKCDVYIVHLSTYLNTSVENEIPEKNCIPDVEENKIKEFHNLLNSMSPTAANDFLSKVKRNLFIKYAKLLKCNAIFTAETTNTLATNLLCNIAVGRGSQVQNDVGFSDIRDGQIKIFRPMKDISKEELNYYITIQQLSTLCDDEIRNNSLQLIISSFVSELQDNFQSTISTVCKTADKIGVHDENETDLKCKICKSNLDTKDIKLSALEATNISRTVSFDNTYSRYDLENNFVKIIDNDINTSVFPLFNKYLCYGCSRNHSETSQFKLPIS